MTNIRFVIGKKWKRCASYKLPKQKPLAIKWVQKILFPFIHKIKYKISDSKQLKYLQCGIKTGSVSTACAYNSTCKVLNDVIIFLQKCY